MILCAICTSDRGPFTREPLGRNDALVDVCTDCATETPIACDSDRGYEFREGMSQKDMQAKIAAYGQSVGARTTQRNETAKTVTPGWIIVRVRRRDGMGKPRDVKDALETLRDRPWFRLLRRLGVDETWVLFERPGKTPAPSSNPLADIEQYRVRES